MTEASSRVGNSIGHGKPRGDDDNGMTVLYAFASTINANLIITTITL